jgi:hypothetical protein
MIMVLPLDTTAPQRTDKLKYIPEPEVCISVKDVIIIGRKD